MQPRAPRLHLITLALKENHRDLPALIEYCRKEFGARSHEVRFPYYLPHLAQWGRDHVLTQGEWNELEHALQQLAAVTELTVCGPQPRGAFPILLTAPRAMGTRSRAHAGGVERTRTRAPAVGRGHGVDRVRAAASSGRAIRMARETALLRGPGNALRRKRRSNAARAARS